MASEEDLRTGLSQPWTSIGLDAGEMSLDGPIFEPHTHPRAFGSMPRFLGHYVARRTLNALEMAIRKITSLPAQREHLRRRGLLRPAISLTSPSSIPRPSSTTPPTPNPINYPKASTSPSSTAKSTTTTATSPAPLPAKSSAAPPTTPFDRSSVGLRPDRAVWALSFDSFCPALLLSPPPSPNPEHPGNLFPIGGVYLVRWR